MQSQYTLHYYYANSKLKIDMISYLDLKVLIHEKVEFCLVGDDDSGPEDVWMIWILSATQCLD